MGGLLNYIIRRTLLAIPTLIGAVTIVFIVMRIVPGDPAYLLAGEFATEEVIERLRAEMNLDKPLHIQYILYLRDLFTGNLGYSYRTQAPALEEILARFPNTLILTLAAMAIAIGVGIFAGVISATRQYSKSDYTVMVLAVFGVSLPNFWQGLMLILIFSVMLGLLPSGGIGGPQHLILPAITLASSPTALIARMTRSSLLEVLRQDYIRTARAKGLPERIVQYRHALRSALIPVITVIGLYFGILLGGAVVTETVFAWPGVGRLLIESIAARDYIMVQAIAIFITFIFVVSNLIVDILYAYIDPRIRYE